MGGQQRLQEPDVDLGVEDRDPLPVGGQDVGVGLGQPGDQAIEAESAQVTTHLAHRVRHAEQGGHLGAKAPVGEPGDGVHDSAQSHRPGS
jgi:hypothetical protein